MLAQHVTRMCVLIIVSIPITVFGSAGNALVQGKEYPEKQIEIATNF